jgi:hypothetical protein
MLKTDQRLFWHLGLLQTILAQAIEDCQDRDIVKALHGFQRRLTTLERALKTHGELPEPELPPRGMMRN